MSEDKGICRVNKGDIMEQVLILGDLAKLSAEQRATYYLRVCESVGLNPLTRPFDYITLNNKLTLYARKDAADQMREKRGVSITDLHTAVVNDVYVATAKGIDKTGRQDTSTGAVFIGGLKGADLANAMMKAETKAKRRMTLSLCGLGFLDETEVVTIPDARVVKVTPEGEILEAEVKTEKPAEQWVEVITDGKGGVTIPDWRNFMDKHPLKVLFTEGLALGATEEQIVNMLAGARDDAKKALADIQKVFVK